MTSALAKGFAVSERAGWTITFSMSSWTTPRARVPPLASGRAEIRQVRRHLPRVHSKQRSSDLGLERLEGTLEPRLVALQIREPLADLGTQPMWDEAHAA
jgi:hypothetical protein